MQWGKIILYIFYEIITIIIIFVCEYFKQNNDDSKKWKFSWGFLKIVFLILFALNTKVLFILFLKG